MVANGHHWNPRYPEPPFPGEFDGEAVHAHHYRTPKGYEGKNVLVLGFGNSAMDIAVETSRVANMTFLAVRRGFHVIPKYLAASRSTSSRTRSAAGCRSCGRAGSFERRSGKWLGQARGLRAADARPPARRGAPDRLVGHPQRGSATAT